MKRFCAAFVILLALTTCLTAQVRDYVALVEPVLHEGTREGFAACASFFQKRGDDGFAAFFRGYSVKTGIPTYGSGWVYLDEAGTPWVVTNRHVVRRAESARVSFRPREGAPRLFTEVPIRYIDERMDLALLELPRGSFDLGFRLRSVPPDDGESVIALGYPAYHGTPLWQYSAGIISNSAVNLDNAYRYLIQHTAPVDPGNSGGPLLTPVAGAPLGYEVVGVNCFKDRERENTNFAVSAEDVRTFLRRAARAVDVEKDPQLLAAELKERAATLEAVLAADGPVHPALAGLVSYAAVEDRGFQSYAEVLALVSNRDEWLHSFFRNPVETLRASVCARFAYDLESLDDRGAIRFIGIDELEPGTVAVSTEYLIAGRAREVVWTREYGHWKVKHAETRKLIDVRDILRAYP